MKKSLLGLLAALVALPAFATSYVFSEGTNSATVHGDRACKAPVVELIAPEHRAEFREAAVQIEGKVYKACAAVKDGFVFIVDEDSDTYVIPVDQFRALKDV